MAVKQAKPARTAVGRTIQRKREMLGWSRPELARHSGVSTSMVQRMEEGARSPSRETAGKLSRALGMNAVDLLRQAGHYPELTQSPLDAEEQTLVDLFRQLSPAFRRAMLAGARAYLQQAVRASRPPAAGKPATQPRQPRQPVQARAERARAANGPRRPRGR